MKHAIIRSGNGLFITADDGVRILAKITWVPHRNYVACDQTWVDSSLRGQGIAGKLLDRLVEIMTQEGYSIKAECSYVQKQFDAHPEKYAAIDWDKQANKGSADHSPATK